MSQPSTYPYGDITFLELVPLVGRILRLLVKLIIKTLLYPISGGTFSLKRTLWRTFVQTICPNSTVRQMQWLSPRVTVMYEQFIRAHKEPGLKIINEDVGEGASLHWIGSKNAKHVMLFFHGGGYVLPAVDGHFGMVDYFRTQSKKRHGIDISVAILEYTLVNHEPWPQQVRQVVAGFQHLLNQGRSPADILLLGDSVGGHQIAFLLGHLLHPHPAARAVPKLATPIAGAAMLSPWLTYEETAPSFAANAAIDLMPTPTLRRWANIVKATRAHSIAETGMDDALWFEPGEAPASWWKGLASVVRAVLFTAGSNECMVDDIISTERKVAEGAGSKLRSECFVHQGAAHDEGMVPFACGDRPTATAEHVVEWIATIFK